VSTRRARPRFWFRLELALHSLNSVARATRDIATANPRFPPVPFRAVELRLWNSYMRFLRGYSAAFMPENAAHIHEMAPTCAAADQLYDERVARFAKGDANDSLWAIESTEDRNPELDLPKIKAKVLLINTVEDVTNPAGAGHSPDIAFVVQDNGRHRDRRALLGSELRIG
jgi:hypothetical protein